jgi:hypothetical protein
MKHLMARIRTLGTWVAVAPASVPGLAEPGGSPSTEMGS